MPVYGYCRQQVCRVYWLKLVLLSHEEDEKYINSDEGQQEIVDDLVNAFRVYKQKTESRSITTSQIPVDNTLLTMLLFQSILFQSDHGEGSVMKSLPHPVVG